MINQVLVACFAIGLFGLGGLSLGGALLLTLVGVLAEVEFYKKRRKEKQLCAMEARAALNAQELCGKIYRVGPVHGQDKEYALSIAGNSSTYRLTPAQCSSDSPIESLMPGKTVKFRMLPGMRYIRDVQILPC